MDYPKSKKVTMALAASGTKQPAVATEILAEIVCNNTNKKKK